MQIGSCTLNHQGNQYLFQITPCSKGHVTRVSSQMTFCGFVDTLNLSVHLTFMFCDPAKLYHCSTTAAHTLGSPPSQPVAGTSVLQTQLQLLPACTPHTLQGSAGRTRGTPHVGMCPS